MTELIISENISLVTFNNVFAASENSFISGIFRESALAGINIDMISQSPATSDRISFGFTFNDEDIPKLITIINDISKGTIATPFMSCGNIKFAIKSQEMVDNVGFAEKVFSALNEIDCLPLLITTGLDEISILVRESDRLDLETTLNRLFQIA